MQTLLKHWADALLEWLGLASAQDSGWDRWVAFTLVLLAVALFDFVCRTILVRGMRRIVKRTKATWDDCPVLTEVRDQREFVNFELLIFWRMGNIESPLLEGNISADKI